jgi:hypothetical protein
MDYDGRYLELMKSFIKFVLEEMSGFEGQRYFDFDYRSKSAKKTNWYLKQIFAQASEGLQSYISTLGVSPDVVQYILSLPQEQSQFLTNEVRKNPGLTLEQLQQVQTPQQKDPYFDHEKQKASFYDDLKFQQWILVSLRKARQGLTMEEMWKDDRITVNYDMLTNKLDEIYDWYRSENVDIASYSWSQAFDMSDEWHKMMAGKGSGKIYEPTKKENIMYGPGNWSDIKWAGWTIQKVTSENDLLVEGNEENMNHCVGSYYDDVYNGGTTILSLRDPENKPHVTIEVSNWPTGEAGTIEQIRGNSNREPDDEYKEMIKDFIVHGGEAASINRSVESFAKLDEDEYNPDIEQINNVIDHILAGETSEYGLRYDLDKSLTELLDEIADKAEAHSNSYYGNYSKSELYNSSNAIVRLAIKEDLELEVMPSKTDELKELISSPNPSPTNWKNIDLVQNWAWETASEVSDNFLDYEIGVEFPQEDNFDNPEDFDKAMEEYYEQESETHSEWMSESAKGSFSQALLKEISDYEEIKLIPSTQDRYDAKKKREEEEIKNSPAYQEGLSRGQQMRDNAMEPV